MAASYFIFKVLGSWNNEVRNSYALQDDSLEHLSHTDEAGSKPRYERLIKHDREALSEGILVDLWEIQVLAHSVGSKVARRAVARNCHEQEGSQSGGLQAWVRDD